MKEIKTKEEIKNFLIALRLIDGDVKNIIVFDHAIIVNHRNQVGGSITGRYIIIKVSDNKYFYATGVSSLQYGYMSKRETGKLVKLEKYNTSDEKYSKIILESLNYIKVNVPLMIKIKIFAIIRAIMIRHKNNKPETIEYFSKEKFSRYCSYVISSDIGGVKMPLESDIERYAKEAFVYFQNRFRSDEVISKLSCPDNIFKQI